MTDSAADFQVALLIAIGTGGMFLLAGAIVMFTTFYQKRMLQEQYKRQQLEIAFQQKMIEAALQSQEEERRRLAGEMHDSIGAMLSAIRLGITSLGKQIPNPQLIDFPKEMLDETIQSVRRISRDLMPATLEKFGLGSAVAELCDRFQATSNLPIHCEQLSELPPFDKTRELMLFRIVQELINNALKHAHATAISVTLRHSPDHEIELTVEDDGVGFDVDAIKNSREPGRGLGIFNIENRVRVLGGSIAYDKTKTKGSKTSIKIPLLNHNTSAGSKE